MEAGHGRTGGQEQTEHRGEEGGERGGGLAIFVREFENRRIPAVKVRGEWWWPAVVVGRVIEQGDDGKRFVRNVTEGDGEEGTDYIRATADEQPGIRTALVGILDEGADSAPSRNDSGIRDASGRGMVLLSQSGLFLGLLRSRKPVGKRFRLWLSREVLPELFRTGRYAVKDAETMTRMEARLSALELDRRTFDSRLAEAVTRTLAGNLTPREAFDNIVEPMENAIREATTNTKIRTAVRRSIQTRLRNKVGHNGAESGWATLPRMNLAITVRVLSELLADLPKLVLKFEAKYQPRAESGPLFNQTQAKRDEKPASAKRRKA